MKKKLEKALSEVLSGLYSADKYLCEDLDSICDDTMHEYAYGVLKKVRLAIQKAVECRDDLQLKSNIEMACEVLKEDGSFFITGVSREDIESRGFETSRLTDEQMARFAEKMADDYVENYFWDSLEGFAYGFNLPTKENSEE